MPTRQAFRYSLQLLDVDGGDVAGHNAAPKCGLLGLCFLEVGEFICGFVWSEMKGYFLLVYNRDRAKGLVL